MALKLVVRQLFVIVAIAALVACGKQADSVTPAISVTDMNSTAQSAAFTSIAQTMTAAQNLTVTPVDTTQPLTPTRTPLPFVLLDGLRVVYIINGNLYIQDSGRQAILLARNVKGDPARPPLISGDGQKIIFYRAGEAKLDSVYVINADGTGEQVLINPELLSSFSNVYDKFTVLFSLAFVPDTHLLLFNTYQQSNFNPESGNFDPESASWLPLIGNDLLIVNADTGKIIQLKEPFQGGNFLAAPNGEWIAVQTLDHIDVIDVQGRIIHRNLVTYSKNENHVVIPIFWTSDSQELIILPSEVPLFAAGATVGRTIWRYPLNGETGIEIKLTPPPVYSAYAVSPDGNWIVYFYSTENNPVADPDIPFGLYIGNLRDKTSQLVYTLKLHDVAGYIGGWSSDNIHFIFADEELRIYMGNIDGEIASLGEGSSAFWIDRTRYLFGWGILGEIGKQELVRVMEHPSDLRIDDPRTFVFLRQ